jgi:hypothetical protein
LKKQRTIVKSFRISETLNAKLEEAALIFRLVPFAFLHHSFRGLICHPRCFAWDVAACTPLCGIPATAVDPYQGRYCEMIEQRERRLGRLHLFNHLETSGDLSS